MTTSNALAEKIAGINAKFPSVKTISPKAAHALKDAVWIDCRDRQERDVSIITRGVIPEADFRPELVPQGAKVVAYCTVGYRSAQFCEKHPGVLNLEGGILNHVANGLDVVDPSDGRPVRALHVWGDSFRQYAPPGYRVTSYNKLNTMLSLPKIFLRSLF